MITQIDKWYSLTMEDIAKMEIECMQELKEMIKSSEISQAYIIILNDYIVMLLVFKGFIPFVC